MHSLNPFLKAFFRSTLPTQCNPAINHILLVPTTDVLLTSKDRESNTLYADLAATDDFLASHVISVSGEIGPGNGSVRDSRGKARQFTTVNGRTVMVKESFVYSSKGFKHMNQAQLLTDVLHYPNGLDSQQWLIYYISKPLIGLLEPVKVTVAILPNIYNGVNAFSEVRSSSLEGQSQVLSSKAGKKDVKSFNDLLNNFPMIARQMQPGLEQVFREFHKGMSDRKSSSQVQNNITISRKSSGASSRSGSNGSIHSRYSNGHVKLPSVVALRSDEEDYMRRMLETAVSAAIGLFQLVDKQQLSFLGASTELTGPVVERLIEKYVSEQLHDSTLFPLLCNSRKLDDLGLESQIHHMEHLDILQVGILIENGRQGKEHLMKRINFGVAEFRKLGVAGSPQQMVDILLTTQKIITGSEPTCDVQGQKTPYSVEASVSEKPVLNVMMNADNLVSLLLLVVIRAHVRHLHARLAYMRNYIFIEDVESGETGYALSTFEAVLSYLASDSGSLRRASRRNGRLWKAVRKGDLAEVRSILDPSNDNTMQVANSKSNHSIEETALQESETEENSETLVMSEEHEVPESYHTFKSGRQTSSPTDISTLAQVFPFQANSEGQLADMTVRKMKRVSMDTRSLSNLSESSFKSRTASRTSTLDSMLSRIDGDVSLQTLSQTQDSEGSSILMMAVDSHQLDMLEYLLNLEHLFPNEFVLEDCNTEGTTLLSAAIQLAHVNFIEIILKKILETREKQKIFDYLNKSDRHGRTAAHYLFNAPQFICRLGNILPWKLKDRNGQTPLLALCRSYDNPSYSAMISDALYFATRQQSDGQPLHLDDHVDAKGNTLLHVVNDPELAVVILRYCDSDPNASNDKRFTPLMVASKYGRIDMVRAFFGDKRVDTFAKEYRGMTAVELAKDDEIRNRIDDLVLVSNPPAADGRVTAVVRSFFVEDASVRLIIKSAIRNHQGMIEVTTCRRSLTDFENLVKWLSIEHSASWLPSIFNFRSPFQLPSKPSKAALQDIQVRLDGFLKIMIAHSTFSTHELLWEFILFPEIEPEMMAERSRMKAKIRAENIKEEFEPVDDVREVEAFVSHARETIRGVDHSTKTLTRRVIVLRNASLDFVIALDICTRSLSTFPFIPSTHVTAFTRYASCVRLEECDPLKFFHQDLQLISSTILAILSSLSRPHTLINSLNNIQKAIDRHTSSLRRSDRWPLGLLDDTRKGIHAEAQDRAEKSKAELKGVSCELRYTQQTVAGELAGWQDLHAKLGKRAIKNLAERIVIREKCRLEGMKRALRGLVR